MREIKPIQVNGDTVDWLEPYHPDVELYPTVSLIVGNSGSGKTRLLRTLGVRETFAEVFTDNARKALDSPELPYRHPLHERPNNAYFALGNYRHTDAGELLYKLQRNNSDAYGRLISLTRSTLIDLDRMEPVPHIGIMYSETPRTKEFEPLPLSITRAIVALAVMDNQAPGNTVFIDDFGCGLSYSLAHDLVSEMRLLCGRREINIVLATSNTVVVDQFTKEPEHVFAIQKRRSGFRLYPIGPEMRRMEENGGGGLPLGQMLGAGYLQPIL